MASVIGLHTCPELILSNYEAADRFQVIRELGRRALQHGYVEKPFMPTILEREESYPTGLEISLPMLCPMWENTATVLFIHGCPKNRLASIPWTVREKN